MMASETHHNTRDMLSRPSMSSSTSNSRKAPPSPLALPLPTSLSPNPQATVSSSYSVTPHARSSFESSYSDLASVRSDLVSLRLGDFPAPPTLLPTIPASPQTPRSLFFSTTPNTPRSTQSGFAHHLQDPLQEAGKALLSSPKSIKGFFTRSNHSQSAFSEQQDQSLEALIAEEANKELTNLSKVSIVPQSQYSEYGTPKESGHQTRSSSPATAGAITPRDWPSSDSGRSSPLPQPSASHIQSEESSRSRSPLRFDSPTVERDSRRGISPSPVVPSPRSSQPPRTPLPAPPSNRSSMRNSASYSRILRQAGMVDMGMDFNEEQLLSTDFITEMLRQPAPSSASSHFLQPPNSDSPRSSASPLPSDRSRRLSNQSQHDDNHFDSDSPSIRSSPISKSRHIEDASDVESSTLVLDVLSPTGEEQNVHTDGQRIVSTLPSSIFPSGGDAVYFEGNDAPAMTPLPNSPGVQSLTVSEPASSRSHGSPHPLVPSTPLSPENFAPSPSASGGFAQAQTRAAQSPRKGSGISQMIASHLPIGRPNSLAVSSTLDGQKLLSLSPRIRQHRYPRNHSPMVSSTPKHEASDNVQMQEMSPTSAGIASPPKEYFEREDSEHSGDLRRGTVMSAKSQATSTQTQRDSLAVLPIPESGRSSDVSVHSNVRHSYHSNNSPHLESNFHSSSSEAICDDLDADFQIVTVVNKAAPNFVRANTIVRPTIVGVAPAVVVQANRIASPTSTSSPQRRHLDAMSLTSGFEDPSPPASPRNPPSVHSPPVHRTDTPESAKSAMFSDDARDLKHAPYLPYDEVTGYGPSNAQWIMYPDPGGPSQRQRPPNANAATSFKSFVSYLSTKSKASTVATKKSTNSSRWAWLLKKPLPPLPPREGADDDEEKFSGDAPQASSRRNNSMEKVPYQHNMVSLPRSEGPQGWAEPNLTNYAGPAPTRNVTFVDGDKFEMLGADSLKVAKRKRTHQTVLANHSEESYTTPGEFDGIPEYHYNTHTRGSSGQVKFFRRNKSRKCIWITSVAVIILVLLFIIGLAVGLSIKKRSTATTCNNGKVGSLCNLDANCTCPAGTSGICSAPLAQELNNLVPTASQLFNVNITSQSLALTIWELQGTASNCSSQAKLVDVGSELDVNTSPNRTHWAQAALMWNLFQTRDINSTQKLQFNVQQLPFKSLLPSNGSTPDPKSLFSVAMSGYLFDFANQTITPPARSFVSDMSPPQTQLDELNGVTQPALDRLYSFASASAIQQQPALSRYWESDLSLNINDLPAFLAAFKTSQIILPFDANAQVVSALINNAVSRTLSFPPPIACYPDLTTSQLSQISLVETQAFGLSVVNSSLPGFDSTCFANHPVYGSLNILRTRLPFADGRSGVAQQAAIVSATASSRAILHVGELLGALPGPSVTDVSKFDVNPNSFGTLDHIHHIALGWLRSFSTTTLAAAAGQFLASNPTGPPPSTSPLSTAKIPTIEAAFFGIIFLSDISSFISSFATPSGSLFFGSPQGETFRRWAQQQSASIAWANSTLASRVVREAATTNPSFESIWNSSSSLIGAGITNATAVQAVIQSLELAQLFSQ